MFRRGEFGHLHSSHGSASGTPGNHHWFLPVTAGVNAGGTVTAVSTTSQTLTPPLVGGGSVNYGSFTPYLAANKQLTIQ